MIHSAKMPWHSLNQIMSEYANKTKKIKSYCTIRLNLIKMLFMKITPLQALKKAIKLTGGQACLARKCGVRPQTVHCWVKRFKRAPTERVLQIEKIVNGEVTRHELRPDFYPPD